MCFIYVIFGVFFFINMRLREHKLNLFISITILVFCAISVAAQSPASRCFQFTWLGPRFNNESVFLNATCQDATRLASGIPCVMPLVASYDGTWPDVDYIWTHHSQHATCELANNDVCAQYTYFFNGHVENSTYMCTRAMDSMGAVITSGCYEARNGSFSTRVCFCRSIPGGVPCNDATISKIISTSTIILVIILIMNKKIIALWHHSV